MPPPMVPWLFMMRVLAIVMLPPAVRSKPPPQDAVLWVTFVLLSVRTYKLAVE